MPSYFVESYLPAQPRRLAEARARARRVAELGDGVRYVRTTFLPEEETCFHLFEAPSSAALGEAARRAQLGHTRIVEALETPA
jgi:Protein of unknown function (DUF4242)